MPKKLFAILIAISFFLMASPVHADCYLQEEVCTLGGSSTCVHFYSCGAGCEHYYRGDAQECCCTFGGGMGDHIFRSWNCYSNEDACNEAPGCFTPQTQISTPSGEIAIKDLKVGDTVKSFDPTTNQETTSLVEKIYEVTRSAYYKIKLKDGTEVQVTGEHPLYAKASSFAKASEDKSEDQPLSFWDYLLTESLTRKVLSKLIEMTKL